MVAQRALLQPLRRWDPAQIDGYVLIGCLGAGAMGRVYLGRSAAGRLVAVKTIKIELADEPDFRTRFAQEVAAARRVSGAFTAAVVAADPEADLPWLATSYVPAPSLSRLVRACGPLPGPAVRWLGAGCAEALESIHGAGLVHRDLKPSNVLVSPDGPRVIDFGIARAAERIQLTVTRGAVGTPAYMAPEQARDTRQATMASDVFSLGATMLFAATGHAPYQGDTVMDVLVRLATEAPDLSGLPGEVADIVSACLQRDPRKRPDSAAVLAHLAPGNPADGRELGPAALPQAALALIAGYRREPRPSGASAEDSAEDETFGSLDRPGGVIEAGQGAPAGRDRQDARAGVAGRDAPAGRDAHDRRDSADATHRHSGPPRGRRLRLAVTATAAALVLIAAGAAAGAAFSGGNRPAAAAASPPPGPPPGQPPPGQPPPGLPLVSSRQGGGPLAEASMSQQSGDPWTGFVVTDHGWPPGRRVSVTLVGVGVAPLHPVVDGAGTFNYLINQDHEFFPGAIPPATYQVQVTVQGAGHAVTSFVVHPSPPGPASSSSSSSSSSS
jgi:Protein kinase domain